MATLSEEDYKKASALKRIYGQKGLGDLFNIEQTIVDLVLGRKEEADEKAVGHVRAAIRKYWQVWMGESASVAPSTTEKAASKSKTRSLAYMLTAPKMVVRIGEQSK